MLNKFFYRYLARWTQISPPSRRDTEIVEWKAVFCKCEFNGVVVKNQYDLSIFEVCLACLALSIRSWLLGNGY